MDTSNPIAGLQPEALWKHFHAVSQIPRASKREQEAIEHVKAIATGQGCSWKQDAVGNLLVSVPASRGCENAPTVAVQSHLDIVCEKNTASSHDFDRDPIKLILDGDWITADGTTLGADNGIGVAAALAILQDAGVKHPPLELFFTVDEETGLTGASGLQAGFLGASILLNLDGEEDGKFYVGCAGGVNTTGTMQLEFIDAPDGMIPVEISVKGLQGGHSGCDIHVGRGNAIKLFA